MSRGLRERLGAEQGFTLIEVLVSALLTLIISAGVATALISATDFTSHERNTSQANEVAQQDQERLKSMTDSQLTSLHQTRTVALNNTQFTVVSTAEFLDANGNSSCASGSEAYFKLTSNVTSAATVGNAAQTVSEEAIITRPLGGTLLVPVVDQTSAALPGATVSVVGQNTGFTASAPTDQNGCTAFAGLPSDSYTITATDAGYVNPNGNSSPTETATVNQTTSTTASTMILGLAGSIKVGFVTQGTSVTYDQVTTPYASGHAAAPGGYDLSYYGSGNGNNMATAACLFLSGKCNGTGTSPNPIVYSESSGVGTVTPGSMFPFYLGSSPQYTSNYQLWAGACEQEQPLQPPAGTDFATVGPGRLATSAAVPNVDARVFEPAIDVAVKYSGGGPYLPAHVSIMFYGWNAAKSAYTCEDTWHQVTPVGHETVGSTVYNTYPAPFASQAAKGSSTASATGDQGYIVVCADYNGYYEWTTGTTLTTTNFTGPTMVPVMDVKTGGY
ncbi:MAG: carboxypeptidase regulatory-like domain-containing protein, partial [Solirubrobacterales bacterium]|nr:carboxypeptidase regulatory-like domain-containing protein [Solirubrobacterales bacterium]